MLHATDRFICRVGTEVTVSVLFSQDHKKCLLLYESIHKKCLILSSQEFARNVNHSYLLSAWRVKNYRIHSEYITGVFDILDKCA